MPANSRSIDGEPLTTRAAMKMEDTLQAFAIRAACYIGELEVPFSQQFDGEDFGATHLIASVGEEPVGAVRVRWFQSFAMPERLAVIQRFRGHGIGQFLLEHARSLAFGRGCAGLYALALPANAKYLEKLGWCRLSGDGVKSVERSRIALVRSAHPTNRLPDLFTLSASTLPNELNATLANSLVYAGSS